ncbi:MAG: hypothetical protein Q8P05_04740 [Candidatus Diapherotrites archaeon]|nr:hypothetical protein [Candidatus Diapherotrites archaeon]
MGIIAPGIGEHPSPIRIETVLPLSFFQEFRLPALFSLFAANTAPKKNVY